MGSIGASELFVIALIGVLLFAAPIAVFVWLIKRKHASPPAPVAALVQCRSCGKGIPPGATACAQCGEPTAA